MISYKKIIEVWNNIFFKEVSNINIGYFRIIWGVLLLTYTSQDFFNIHDLYGDYAIISLPSTLEHFSFSHLNIFQYLGVKKPIVFSMMIIYIVSIISFTLGYKTKSSLILIITLMVSFHQRNIWLLSSSEVLIRTITILIFFTHAEKALSLDAFFKNKYSKNPFPSHSNPWAFRLIQIQLSVVYLLTVWHKLKGETWVDGTALYYATRLDEFKNLPVPYVFDSIFFLRLGTWLTLLTEFSLGLFIWIKEARKFLIYIGIFFHLFIEYSMNIPFFEYVMCLLILSHLKSSEYEYFTHKIKFFYEQYLRPQIYKLRGTSPTAS